MSAMAAHRDAAYVECADAVGCSQGRLRCKSGLSLRKWASRSNFPAVTTGGYSEIVAKQDFNF
jgi:hypothetical protein